MIEHILIRGVLIGDSGVVLFCVYLRKYMCSASELGVRRYCGLLPPLITLALLLPWRRLRCLSIFQCSSSAGGGRRKLESRSLATTNRLTSNTDEHPSMSSIRGEVVGSATRRAQCPPASPAVESSSTHHRRIIDDDVSVNTFNEN